MKLGIAGTGKIVEDALFAMSPLEEVSVNAIFARPHSKAKGDALAEQYGISAVYTDYEEMLDQADVDTVYIGLINSVHYEYAKKALERGQACDPGKAFCRDAGRDGRPDPNGKATGTFRF